MDLAIDVGAKRRVCPMCTREFWVSVQAPLVSTTEPARNAGAGAVIASATTVVGLDPVGQRRRGSDTHGSRPDAQTEPVHQARRPAPRTPARRAPSPLAEPESARPDMTLGGLQLLARIGGGGMGTVWLARQLSLDRNVAVKVLRPHLSSDPAFVIQFTREALAAAQLVHHNIAQIYDIGLENELHYFSMEYVDGEPLSALLRREGRLAPEVAAGYLLQAARGLRFAHDRGMIHRDIKPENLLLNRDGIVKVADLGLVKRVDGREIGEVKAPSATAADLDFITADMIMGTPAYMAPEQALDSTTVDARADIYSLGCTLYDLVTGRPPFEGETMGQTIGMHVLSPPTPPEAINHRVPAGLSEIVLKMMAKKPADRFEDMGGVIAALERFLNIDASVFSPREEHAALLERSVAAFNTAPWARWQRYGRAGSLGLAFAVVVGAGFLGAPAFAAWTAAFIVATVVTSFFINAFAQRAPLLLKLRHLVLGAPLWTWAIAFAASGAGLGAVAWFGHLRGVAENVSLAIAAGLLSFITVDRRVTRQRRPPVAAVEGMLKAMRLRGLEEQKLRQFVCRYSGEAWEEFYEALFGYEAMLDARARWGRDEKGVRRRRYRVWRDPLIRFIDARLARRQKKKEQRQLAIVERPGPGSTSAG